MDEIVVVKREGKPDIHIKLDDFNRILGIAWNYWHSPSTRPFKLDSDQENFILRMEAIASAMGA